MRHTWAFLVTQFFLPAFMLLFVDGKRLPQSLSWLDPKHSTLTFFFFVHAVKVDKGRADANAFYEKEQAAKKQALLDSATEMVQDGSGFEQEKDVLKTV